MLSIRKVLCSTFLLLIFSVASFCQNIFSIAGEIPTRYDGIQINLTSDNPNFKQLSANVKNGRFFFSGKLDDLYEKVSLTAGNDNKIFGWWSFFIKKGKMRIRILMAEDNTHHSDIEYSNIPFIREQEEYEAQMKPAEEIYSLARKKYQLGQINHDSLLIAIRHMRLALLDQNLEFAKKFRNTFIALYYFKREVVRNPLVEPYITADSLMSVFSSFDVPLKNTRLGKSVFEYISHKQALMINRVLPDFSFLTDKGKYLKLSSFQGNHFVLLCFWNAGCQPCIKSFPLFENIAKKYEGSGLQLISVSTDAEESRWRKALQVYNLPWLQTCDISSHIPGTRLQALYDINLIPQYFLIDKQGRLIYHNIQLKENDDYGLLQNLLVDIFE